MTAVGLRPMVVNFFLTLNQMADRRLLLQELLRPMGRDWTMVANKSAAELRKLAKSRWKLLWHGHDAALRVLHRFIEILIVNKIPVNGFYRIGFSLDFLRKCREISDWYGPAFYFTANPLMLPFPMFKALEALKLSERVSFFCAQPII